MTTLIAQIKSEGGTRRCDAACHRAKTEKCACICEGKYHGLGDEAAREAVARDADAGLPVDLETVPFTIEDAIKVAEKSDR